MKYDNVNNPAHYQELFGTRPVECIDITRHLPFCIGNAFKYVWRAGRKGSKAKALEDLDKALWYIEDARLYTYTIPPFENGRALAVFRQLRPEDTNRYRALFDLVYGSWHLAETYVRNLRKEIEEGAEK